MTVEQYPLNPTRARPSDHPLAKPFRHRFEGYFVASVAGGEILGIAGIAGNGQSELMDALSGEILAGKPESVTIDGTPAGHLGLHERRRIRGRFVPEERNAMAPSPP